MHVWDCVTAIVFVVAADEFDQPEYRDNAGQEVGGATSGWVGCKWVGGATRSGWGCQREG